VKRLWGVAVVLGAIGLAVAILRLAPAHDFLFIPHKASPLAGFVHVQGATPAGKGDVYFVDVFVRRTSRLEQWLPFTRPDGSTLVRAQDYLPQGTSEAQHVDQTEEEIRRSELVAPAVAMSALGYKVIKNLHGALVIGVAPDAPAAGKLQEGDVIVSVDGTPVRTTAELRAGIGKRTPGEKVTLTVRRGGKNGRRLDVTLRTIPAPDNPERPIVGIQVDQAADIELPRAVKINLGAVRGPSAGLPFALEVARELGRNVTHGCRVAATGELDLEGDVLPVGGLKQKTIGARRTGVDVFLVPAGDNAAEAQRNAGGLRIVPVDSFQQALRYLTTSHLKC
jgi:PDZ domain-containing protein